jgi:hypothetical protein
MVQSLFLTVEVSGSGRAREFLKGSGLDGGRVGGIGKASLEEFVVGLVDGIFRHLGGFMNRRWTRKNADQEGSPRIPPSSVGSFSKGSTL